MIVFVPLFIYFTPYASACGRASFEELIAWDTEQVLKKGCCHPRVAAAMQGPLQPPGGMQGHTVLFHQEIRYKPDEVVVKN